MGRLVQRRMKRRFTVKVKRAPNQASFGLAPVAARNRRPGSDALDLQAVRRKQRFKRLIHGGRADQHRLLFACKALCASVTFASFAGDDSRFRSESMKTFSAKPGEVPQDWYVVDAAGKTLGRLATEVARRLRGKHKPQFTAHVDTGDFIVVVNASKVRVTGRKPADKIYHHHTGYIGNL